MRRLLLRQGVRSRPPIRHGLAGVAGNLCPGAEADFVLLNPQATPLLARRTAAAQSLAELLFAFIILGDDRAVERSFCA